MLYIYTVFHLASDLFYCCCKSEDCPAVSRPDGISLQCPFSRRKSATEERETVSGKDCVNKTHGCSMKLMRSWRLLSNEKKGSVSVEAHVQMRAPQNSSFFLMWTILKVFIEFVTIFCFCFMFWFFGHKACGILAPWPGIEPAPPTVKGEVLISGPPGKSPWESVFLVILSSWYLHWSWDCCLGISSEVTVVEQFCFQTLYDFRIGLPPFLYH